jgi:hypothetical protein
VPLEDLRDTAVASGMTVEAVSRPGTQYCLVLLRRPLPQSGDLA